ncbi:MAG: outer membrane protein [Mesorhizobium sp.]
MKLLSRLLLSSAALAAWPLAQAVAADYDAPLYIEEAPEYVPVEIGSGWYLRGDVSYNFGKPFRNLDWGGPTVVDEDYDESHTALSGAVGFGYHFSDHFRGDLNLGFLSSNDQNLSYAEAGVSSTTVSVENEVWTGMANAYVDLGTYVGITPYLGGGLGIAYAERKQSYSVNYVDVLTPDIDQHDDKNQITWAYSLNAGASYQFTQNVSVDVGYSYLAAPSLEYYTIREGEPEIAKGLKLHQVKVGLRYDLW